MLKFRDVLIASVLLSSVAYAEREKPPRPDRGMSMYKEGTQVFNREISPYFDTLTRECLGDPSQKWLERLADLDAKSAKVAKPEDRQQLVAYLAVLRPWVVDKIKNVPDVGTWADAKAAVQAMIAFSKVAPPPIGSSDAELRAMIAYSIKERAVVDKASKALSYAQNKLSGCEEFLGKPADLFPVSGTLTTNLGAVEEALTERARELALKKYEPLRNVASDLAAVKAATSWDGQMKQMNAAFEGLALAKDIVANEELYLALGGYDSAQYGADAAVPEAKRVVAEFGPKIVKMLEDVSFPTNTKKDAARDAVAKKWLEGRKVLNGPLNWGNVNKETIHEVENGINYEVKRETAFAYFVVKPATWTRPAPDGIATDDLCELSYFYHGRFTKGPPSYKSKINKWSTSAAERFVAPILCKNAKRISKLK